MIAVQAMAKASKETNELIEKLQTELAAVKRQTNNYRGGWRGRGRGRGRGNGRGGHQNYPNNEGDQSRSDAAIKRTADGTPVTSKKE